MSGKKLFLILALLTIFSLLIGACGGGTTPAVQTDAPQVEPTKAEETSGEAPQSQGKFAIITSGPKDDNSWNEAAFNGAEALKAKGYEAAFSERIAEGDELRILREYGSQGYNMIVAHGFGYQDGVFEVAAEFPEINFAWAGGINHTDKNVGDYDQPFYQGAYPVGVLAGHMSKSGVLGALYGFDIPVCHAMGEAFLAGAQSVNPEARLLTTAVGVWEDVAAAKEAALAQADVGADFWIECGEGPALGAIEAAKERGGYVTGYVGDMSENGPDVVLSSIVWQLEPLFEAMMQQTMDKSFDNEYYQYGIKEGSLEVAINPALKDQIPAEAIQAVEKSIADVKSGTFEVPYIPEAGAEAAAPTEAPAISTPDLSGTKFALITSGPQNDNSWNEAAFLGVEAVKSYGAETAFSERIAEGDELRILREYASQGYNMIVAHGFGYQDGVFQIAEEFPNVNFAWAGGINHTAKNVGDYDQPFYQAAYPIGVLAGYMSKSGVLGSLSGFDIPVCHSMGEAFLAGAQSVNPDAKLLSTAVGVWEDVAAAKEAALAQADAGVDFWIECGEGPALGAIEAAKERGGYVTGYVGDMSENGPDVVLASVYWNLDPLFSKMLEQTKETTFDNPFYQLGMQEGSVQVALNQGLISSIPVDALTGMQEVIDDIVSGAFEVPYIPEGQ
jgi:basic membrane protein A